MVGSNETKAGPYRVDITVDGLVEHARAPVPVRCGVPLPKGLIVDTSRVGLQNDRGLGIPFQAAVTGYWPERSIKWLNLDFLADTNHYVVVIGAGNDGGAEESRIFADESEYSITINTGRLKLEVPTSGATCFPGRVWIDRDGDGVFFQGRIGRRGRTALGSPSGRNEWHLSG